MLRDTTGGAGGEGGRGRDCQPDPAVWSGACNDGGATGKGPSGKSGNSGRSGISKIKIVTHHSTIAVIKPAFVTQSVRWLNG